ncbi:MAG: hypothetical protein MJ252_28530 [archaeon]|nr:hypothetical protein [archaeon]
MDKEKCTLDGVEEADEATRAAKAIEDSKKIGAETYIEPADINSGNPNLNLLYTSSIFNAKSGLDIPISKPPQLARVCEENEKFDDLILLPPDEILIKWFNFHLKNAGQEPIK